MMLLDTDVAVDQLRGHADAVNWLAGLGTTVIGLPGLVVMELLQGCRDKPEQQRIEQFVKPFMVYRPSVSDCDRALHDFASFRLSNNLGLLDALIGETAVGLAEPLATLNTKQYGVIPRLITIQPY